jgi:curved DNA-binding protein
MEFRDHYKVLAMGRSATQEEITRKFHPDFDKEPAAES